MSFGIDVGPITATTRNVWLNKLKAEKKKRRSALAQGDAGNNNGVEKTESAERMDID